MHWIALRLNDRERTTVARSLAARHARLMETIGDTTESAEARKSGLRELKLISGVLGKLRCGDKNQPAANSRDEDD